MENNKVETENKAADFAAQVPDIDKLSVEQIKDLISGYIEENGQLEKELESAKREADSFKDKWVRGAAEFENYKKRTALSRIQGEEEGKAYVLLKILPIGDNLERALKMTIDAKTKEGLEMLAKSFKEVLEKAGVTEINPEGEPFDPNFHEAVMQCTPEDESDCGNVKEVFLKGYKLNDKVIRYAQVKVIAD